MKRTASRFGSATLGTAALLGAVALWACPREPDGALTNPVPGIVPFELRPGAGELAVPAAFGGTARSLASEAAPRLDGFTAICSYSGPGLLAQRKSATVRGCNAASGMPPAGIRAHTVAAGFDWNAWMASTGLKQGEFGALVQTETARAVQGAGGSRPATAGDLLTLELRWPFLDPSSLAGQAWFTGTHSTEERAASEGSYYGGCVRAVTGEIAAAQARGWGGVALSLQAAPAGVDGLPADWVVERIVGPALDRGGAWSLELGGRTPTARVLEAAARLDRARALLGGAGRRVRAVVSLAGATPEDARALALLPFFSGAEGIELRASEAEAVPQPVFAAVEEGLGLACIAQRILRDGRPASGDGLAAAVAGRRPLLRLVSSGAWHAVMTYDPFWAEAGNDRSVLVPALADLPGTTVRLPAGRDVRIFLLHAAAAGPSVRTSAVPAAEAGRDPLAEQALERISRLVPRFRVIDLPATGTVEIQAGTTLTIEDLRGVALDDDPPILGQPPAYKPGVGDGLQPAERAFPARGLAPFRFRHFRNEFNITGRGTAELSDYASTRGFILIANRPRTQHPHLPLDAKGMVWLSRATPKDIDRNYRYDLLAEQAEREDLATLYASDPYSRNSYKPRDPGTDLLMIDIEHGVLKPETLRHQAWYPKEADSMMRSAFETKYYRGYRLMYTAAIEAGRRAGYPQISLYGWYTVPRTWWGLEKLKPDPATDWAWNAYGKDIYPLVDIIHPSVYCFYVAAQNVAYTLANLDLTRQFLAALPVQKPMRPYYWLKYHGGGAMGTNWWQNQPIVDEEVRAMHAMAFFTGIDGLDQWDWFGHPRYAGIPDPGEDKHLMVGRPFACTAEDGSSHAFQRYDVLHVLSCDTTSGLVRFQRIIKDRGPTYGVGEGQPVYAMPRDDLRQHLRPWLENAAAMFEGLALAHPFEYLLRHGTVRIDVPSQEQFAKTLPIVRRVKLGRHHVVITYDPNVLYARLKAGEQSGLDAGTDHSLRVNPEAAGKGIVLTDFDGRPGLTLRLPADDQVRIVVLRDP